MTWTAILTSVEREAERWVYRIVFTDGVTKFERAFNAVYLTDEVIKQTARNVIAQLEAVTAVDGKISLQVGGEIDLTPPVPPKVVIDPAQVAQSEWLARYRELQQFYKAINAGLIAAEDKRIPTLEASLRAAWSEAYLDRL